MREPNVIVSRDNLSVMCVHKGRGSISCFGVLERMPRIISTILSEGTIWHSQHLFDAYVRVAFCRGWRVWSAAMVACESSDGGDRCWHGVV